MYEVKVELVHESDGILDARCSKFAFRTVELVRERDRSEAENDTDESFYLRVNGVPVYCKVLKTSIREQVYSAAVVFFLLLFS